MRNRTTLSLLAGAALLAAVPAMASDPDPMTYSKCSSGCATVVTDGPVACDGGANTCITYNVSGTTTPDHLGLFLRSEAVVLSVTSGPQQASYNITTACGKGDSVLGLGSSLLCHERLIRFDNRSAKAVTFTLKVQGKRKPIITTVVARKGTTQCANPIVGIGLEEPPAPASCVNSCGSFDPKQSVRKSEKFQFESCIMEFNYAADGSVALEGGFVAYPAPGAPIGTVCTPKTGLIGEIFVSHVPETENKGMFGDGWLNTGDNSCSTRMIGGSYYTVCW
jgi:hypothetical protein